MCYRVISCWEGDFKSTICVFMAGIKFDIIGDSSSFKKAVSEAAAGVNDAKSRIESDGQSMGAVFDNLKGKVGMIFTAAAATELVSRVAHVRGEFQQLEVAFTTMLGSADKSSALMAQLTQTAAITPFGLQEVASGAKQLLAYGTSAEKVNETLIRLGDIAAGLSIPLGDLVYLYGTTQTQGRLFTQDMRQFMGRGIPIVEELAKQFGVTKDEVGALVTAGKVGFPEVEKAIVAMTSEGGKFGGLMEAQSKTIVGQISNLEDAVDMMFNQIGQSSEGLINTALSGVGYLIENYETIGTILAGIAGAYGINRAAIALYAATANATAAQEIAAYSALLPSKQASTAEDVKAMAAKRGISQARMEELIAMKAQAQAQVQELQLTAANAVAKQKAAQQALVSATAEVEITAAKQVLLRREFEQAVLNNDVKKKSALLTEMQTASDAHNAAVKAQQNAQVALNSATQQANIATTNAQTAATNLNTVATQANAKSVNVLTLAMNGLKKAGAAVSAFMAANPYLLLGAAIIGAAYAAYKMATALSVEEAAANYAKEAVNELTEAQNKLKQDSEGYIQTIRDENKTSIERAKAYNELKNILPEITQAYSLENIQIANQKELQNALNKEIERTTLLKLQQKIEEKKNEGYLGKTWEYLKEDTWGALGQIGLNMTGIFGAWVADFDGEAEKFRAESEKKLKEELENMKANIAEAEWLALPLDIRIAKVKENEERIKKEMGLVADEIEKYKNDEIPDEFQKDIFLRLNVQMSDLEAELAEWLSKINQSDVKTYAQQKSEWRKQLTEARALLKEQSKDTSTATETQREDTRKTIKDLKKKLGISSKSKGKTPQELERDALVAEQNLNKIIQKNAEERVKITQDAEFQRRELEIAGMEDVAKRKEALLQLERDKEAIEHQRALESAKRAEIERQKAEFDAREKETQAEKAKSGEKYVVKTFSEADIDETKINAIADKYNQIWIDKTVARIQKQEEAETSARLAYLAEYGSYEEKRLAIAQQYQKQIDEATTQGDKDILAKQMQNALAELDIEAGKATSSIGKLFSDLSKKTGKELQQISTNGQKALKFITEEQWDEAKGAELGITKEMYDSIKGDPAKLAELVKKIEEIKNAADDAKGPIATLADGFEEMFKAGGDSNKFSKGLEKAMGAMGKLNNAVGFVSGALSQMSEAFGGNFLGGIAEGLNVATDAMGSAMEGAQAGAVFGPWGAAAGAAIGMVSSLASSLSKMHDAKHEKRIQEIQEQIERTEKQYDKLGDAADDAFSTTAAGIINEQNLLLERQQRLIRAQIQEEEQKKSADQQRIKDWKEELEEIQDQIKENELAAIDAINGTDIQSAISDFADAYIEAWQSGTDMADSSLKMVRKMIRTGLTEYLKSTIAPDIENFMQKMSEYLADGVISPWEDDMLQSLAGEAERKANEYFKVTEKYWEDETEATSGSTTGVESMSQDTADEMNGRMTAIQVAIEAIRTNSTTDMLALQGLTTQIAPMVVTSVESNRTLSEIRNLAIQRNDYLADIASYTKLLITISKNISSVKTNTQNI